MRALRTTVILFGLPAVALAFAPAEIQHGLLYERDAI